MDVVYVDEDDNLIGSGSISNAIDNGINVRISRVFLFNSKGELLLQKRSDAMTLPGKWDQTAAGHVDKGENYYTAAAQELSEEMGIAGVELREVATFYTEETDEAKVKRRFNKIFTGVYNGEVVIDNNEVSDYQWISLEELKDQMGKEPENFTQGFIETLKVYTSSATELGV